MKNLGLLSCDIGASGGRIMHYSYDGQKIAGDVLHRFVNMPVRAGGSMYWDILNIFSGIIYALSLTASKGMNAGSLSIATWGNDFGLLDGGGYLIENPYHYRDSRTEGMIEEVRKIIPDKELYARTGMQFGRFTALNQLFSLAKRRPEALERADRLLFIPDLLNYWLCGNMFNEFTFSSTSQFFNCSLKTWDNEILEKLRIPQRLMGEIVQPGTLIGKVKGEYIAGNMDVIAAPSHDTASAVLAVPADSDDFAYISSGTWSLVGVETDKPVLTDDSRKFNFSNEGGAFGRNRYIKNVMGLWLMQECLRIWKQEGKEFDLPDLLYRAESSNKQKAVIDPDKECFFSPVNMPGEIRRECAENGFDTPETEADITGVIMLSLACKYRWAIEKIESVAGKRIDKIHIVGGGCQNSSLNQLTADLTGKDVYSGPVEATSIGAALIQLYQRREINNIEDARSLVRGSFETRQFKPQSDYAQTYSLFETLVDQ